MVNCRTNFNVLNHDLMPRISFKFAHSFYNVLGCNVYLFVLGDIILKCQNPNHVVMSLLFKFWIHLICKTYQKIITFNFYY